MNKTITIKCGVCGSTKAYQWYDKQYKGYLAYCPICNDQWKVS
jgi:transcription elongation factor Elf1